MENIHTTHRDNFRIEVGHANGVATVNVTRTEDLRQTLFEGSFPTGVTRTGRRIKGDNFDYDETSTRADQVRVTDVTEMCDTYIYMHFEFFFPFPC